MAWLGGTTSFKKRARKNSSVKSGSKRNLKRGYSESCKVPRIPTPLNWTRLRGNP